MHPPFGFALFYLRAIAPPEVKTTDIYWGSLPWIALQLVLVGILIFWPESVTYWIADAPDARPGRGGAGARGAGDAGRRRRPGPAAAPELDLDLELTNAANKRLQHGGLAMKRRNFLKAAAGGGAAAALAAPAIAQTPAEGAVAPDLGLPALARHDLRRGRGLRRARQGDDRRQLRDRGLPGGRDRADAAGGRGGRHRHRRDDPHLLLLLLGQGPDLRARHRRSRSGSTRG